MIWRIDLPDNYPIIAAFRLPGAVCGVFRTYQDLFEELRRGPYRWRQYSHR